MTADELRALLLSGGEAELLSVSLIDDSPPYVCDADEQTWSEFSKPIVKGLGVEPIDVRIIGSGRLSFSLAPAKNLRIFTDKSDIDVAIVNERLFDEFWFALLRSAYPRPPLKITPGGWVEQTQRSTYTGWFSPEIIQIDHRISGASAADLVRLRTAWFTSMKLAATHLKKRHEDIKGRLYRTWSHAELYHAHSVAALRKSLKDHQ